MTWSQLRALGNSPLVKATVIIPLLGYVILLNKQLTQYAALDPRFAIFADSFPWQLVLTYAGLTALAVGSVTYTLWCPKVIKRFGEPAEYFAADFKFYWPRDQFQALTKYVTSLLEKLATSQVSELDKVVPKRLEWDQVAVDERAAEAQLTNAMVTEWHIENLSKRAHRFVCACAFILGIAITVGNAAITFGQVFVSAMQAAAGV